MNSKEIFNKLINKFEHIYLLTLSHRKDRQQGILSLLKELGYDENNIEHLKKFSIVYSTIWPFNGLCANAFNAHYKRYCFTKANEYDCTRNHFNIIKTAYDLGYESILVMEDDIRFLKPRMLNNFITNFPEYYSMVLLSGFTNNPALPELCKERINDGIFFFNYQGNIWCTALYALSRDGMSHYISYITEKPSVADMPIYHHPKNGYYISSYPLAIQADHLDIPSDIRNETNDNIDYAKENTYEFVDKTKYMSYPII